MDHDPDFDNDFDRMMRASDLDGDAALADAQDEAFTVAHGLVARAMHTLHAASSPDSPAEFAWLTGWETIMAIATSITQYHLVHPDCGRNR